MNIKHLLMGLAAAILVSGAAHAATQADYDQALAAANTAVKAANDAGYEWRDTGKLLKKAAEAAKAGDYATATKLAQKAEFQGKMAQQQGVEQANAGNPTYLY